jgi:uncharacterized protein (DUF1697 family)
VTQCVALLRGINVGKAKRIAMADLKHLVEELGHGNVRTLLNSGNVVFDAARPNTGKIAAAISESITKRCGFIAAVTVVTAPTLSAIVAENPLLTVATNPSAHLVAFAADPKTWARLAPLTQQVWKPDALSITGRAAYLWCATGILESPMNLAFARQAGQDVTARNWATVLKLQALTAI